MSKKVFVKTFGCQMDELIAVYEKIPKPVSQLHLPVQHGSDRILAAMKRGYSALGYKSTVCKRRVA